MHICSTLNLIVFILMLVSVRESVSNVPCESVSNSEEKLTSNQRKFLLIEKYNANTMIIEPLLSHCRFQSMC